MGNLFRRIFNPTKEERVKDLRILIKLHRKNFGNCYTCVYHEGSTMPGFVTDYGECLKNAPWFTRKILDGNNEFPCSFYEENTQHVQNLEHQIKLLNTEYPELNDHFTKKKKRRNDLMTCREKLMKEKPDHVNPNYWGGCVGCPSTYNYLDNPEWCIFHEGEANPELCAKCWGREIPESNEIDSAAETERDFYLVRVEFADKDRVETYRSETCTVSTEAQAVILRNVKYVNYWKQEYAEGIVIPLKNIRTLSYKKVNENDVSAQN